LLELLLALLATVLVDRHSLLAAPLYVALDELLGVLLEDVVDLVEELVDVFLDLLALLGQLRARGCSVAASRALSAAVFFLLLLSHLALHGARTGVAKPPRRDATTSSRERRGVRQELYSGAASNESDLRVPLQAVRAGFRAIRPGPPRTVVCVSGLRQRAGHAQALGLRLKTTGAFQPSAMSAAS